MKEYFNIVNIEYYDALLGILFLRKNEVVIDFVNNCLKIKDNIIGNQANKYKVGEGNPQKNKKKVSMKALKQEELKIPYCFSLPRGIKVDCMTDIGWGEFDRIFIVIFCIF